MSLHIFLIHIFTYFQTAVLCRTYERFCTHLKFLYFTVMQCNCSPRKIDTVIIHYIHTTVWVFDKGFVPIDVPLTVIQQLARKYCYIQHYIKPKWRPFDTGLHKLSDCLIWMLMRDFKISKFNLMKRQTPSHERPH